MTPAAIIELLKDLAVLGASPAVQQLVLTRLATLHGHSVEELQAMAAAQVPAWVPAS